MVNKQIAALFNLLAGLMELHGENAFKTKAYAGAYLTLRKLDRPLAEMTPEEIQAIPGIGASVAAKISELLSTGKMELLESYKARTPEGVQQLLAIKGLGPRKIKVIWEALRVESPAELLYACEENRLIPLPGFGQKTQEDLKQKVTYFLESADRHLFGQIEPELESILQRFRSGLPDHQIHWIGDVAVRKPVVDKIGLLIAPPVTPDQAAGVAGVTVLESDADSLHVRIDDRLSMAIFGSPADTVGDQWMHRTFSPALAEALTNGGWAFGEKTGAEALAGTPWAGLPVEWYDLEDAVSPKPDKWVNLIDTSDIRGILHNHSDWSDGAHTLEEMAVHVRDQGYAYFAICDHSRSAFYANGLDVDRVLAQAAEIDRLNQKLAPFRVFKGIESDILGDGSLDYEEDVLAGFDLIVASVHSNLRMDEDKANVRLIKAIEHPRTHILGHPTGRLLLARPGYPIDHRRIIDACAANGVAIELNANPLRLDIDYSWIPYCLEKGVPVSINPDAHSRGQVDYVRYGVMAARRGGLTKEACLNARSLPDFVQWLAAKQ